MTMERGMKYTSKFLQYTSKLAPSADEISLAIHMIYLGLVGVIGMCFIMIITYIVKSELGIKILDCEGPLHELIYVPLQSILDAC
jgi:hypothetical protein